MLTSEDFRPFLQGEPKRPEELSDKELAAEILRVSTLTKLGRSFSAEKVAEILQLYPQFKLRTDCGISALAKEATNGARGALLEYVIARASLEHERRMVGWDNVENSEKEADLADKIWEACEQGQQVRTFNDLFGDPFRGELNTVSKHVTNLLLPKVK